MSRTLAIWGWLILSHAAVGFAGYAIAPRTQVQPQVWRPAPPAIAYGVTLACPATTQRIIEYNRTCAARARSNTAQEITK